MAGWREKQSFWTVRRAPMASVWISTLTLLFVLLVHGIQAAASSTPITCKTGYSRVGDETFVTCNFHRNINDSKPGISVIRYPLSSSDTDKENDVLKCVWEDDEENPDCIVAEGYTFDFRITDHLTLKIPAATDKVAGLYVCHVIPQGNFYPHACDLTVNSANTDGTTTTERPTVSTESPTPSNDNAVPHKDTENCKKITSALITIVCLQVLIIITLFTVLAKRHLIRRNTMEAAYEEGIDGSPTPTTPLISMEMEMAGVHQGSDTSPLLQDFRIHTSSLDVQTDFTSSETIERVKDIPPFSVYKEKLSTQGLRQRKTKQSGPRSTSNTKLRAATATGNQATEVSRNQAVLGSKRKDAQCHTHATAGSYIDVHPKKPLGSETDQNKKSKKVKKVPDRINLPSGLRGKGRWNIEPADKELSKDT